VTDFKIILSGKELKID